MEGPTELIGGGEHFDDVGVSVRRKQLVAHNTPRERMYLQEIEKGMRRPRKRPH